MSGAPKTSGGPYPLPVLAYHGIQDRAREYEWTDAERPYVISKDCFEQQMAVIRAYGLISLSVSEMPDWQNGREKRRVVMITFDDGHISHVQHVAPVLKRKNLKGIFFIPAGLVGGDQQMGWAELRSLVRDGFDIGSHGLRHIPLSDLSEPELLQELQGSKAALEDHLQIPVRSLSIPKGFYSERISSCALEVGYEFIFTSDFDVNHRRRDRFHLKRLAVRQSTSMEEFSSIVRGRLGAKRYIEGAKTIVRSCLNPSAYQRLSFAKRWFKESVRAK